MTYVCLDLPDFPLCLGVSTGDVVPEDDHVYRAQLKPRVNNELKGTAAMKLRVGIDGGEIVSESNPSMVFAHLKSNVVALVRRDRPVVNATWSDPTTLRYDDGRCATAMRCPGDEDHCDKDENEPIGNALQARAGAYVKLARCREHGHVSQSFVVVGGPVSAVPSSYSRPTAGPSSSAPSRSPTSAPSSSVPTAVPSSPSPTLSPTSWSPTSSPLQQTTISSDLALSAEPYVVPATVSSVLLVACLLLAAALWARKRSQ